jgi:lipopolysaccharide export system protein LptA
MQRKLPSGLAASIALALFCLPVQAERADRDQPTNIEADKLQYDDAKQTTVFTGNVVLTKGTIVIRGDRMVLRQFQGGGQTAVATGKRASFRQKRDGLEQFVEGYANEIHYDSRNETLRLVGNSLVKRLECDVVIDEVTGGVIVYSSRTEQVEVDGKGPGESSGRVRITIQPRPESGNGGSGQGAAKCPPGTPTGLRPAAGIEPRRTAAATPR